MASPNITANLRHMVRRAKRQEWQVITGKNKTLKPVISMTVIPETAWRESVPRTPMSATLWYCGSQEVARSNLSNERTFQARHCGLWLQPPAHAVLTTKKQAKLFTDSSLTSLAKKSPIPSSYCHHSLTFSLPLTLIFLSLLFFFIFLFLTVPEVVFKTRETHTLLLKRARDTQIENLKAKNPTWARLRPTDSHIQTHTGALLCLACSASISVDTACDSSG